MSRKIGVGIIGVQPNRSWAANAHIPALKALADDFEIVALSNTRQESADAAAAHYGIPHAFDTAEKLANCDGVDLVAVTVKVPHHLELVRAAVNAGKHVYCEWPLGNGLAEAREIAAMADKAGVVAACGMQARFSPALNHVRALLDQGYAGDILSVSVIGSGLAWGPFIDSANAYLYDKRNGATMLSIPVGHTMEGLCHMLGDITDIRAQIGQRRTTALNVETGENIPMTSPDQVLFNARIGDAPLSVHYRGGTPRGTGLLIEINGSAGDLQISGFCGHAQMIDLSVQGATGDDRALAPLAIPSDHYDGTIEAATAGNVARFYKQLAQQIRTGASTVPTFADAVKRHQMLAAIEASAQSGTVAQPGDY